MKKLINKPENIVVEMLEGIEAASDGKISKLENMNVLVSNTFNKNNVALISGGGSGHEPAHGGYVGDGMLAAAIAGEVFTSPTPDLIQAAIEKCDSKKGTLLIIKNYTGDVLNFRMTAELAKISGREIETVIVNDDISLRNTTSSTGRRGIAGTVFVHKIAGAKAQAGANLKEVKDIAQYVIDNTATIGLGLDACIVPARGKKGFILKDNEVEMGLGIHGEPGIEKTTMKPVNQFVEEMLNQIIDYLKLKNNDEVGLMINGLGATPLMELYIANRKAQQMLKAKNIKVAKTFVGNYMTAIDMPGMSISVVKLNQETKKLLLDPSDTLAIKM